MKRLVRYLKNVKNELKKVTWPSGSTTLQMTVLVLIVTTIWGVYTWLLDLGFGKLMSLVIK